MGKQIDDRLKVQVVQTAFTSFYNDAQTDFSANPSAENFEHLKDTMYGYQYAKSANNEEELLALYNHHPVGKWLSTVIARIKEECKSVGANY